MGKQHKLNNHRIYVLYDGRAAFGDTESASVCSVSDTLKEARADRKDFFPDGIIFSYIEDAEGLLVDKRREE